MLPRDQTVRPEDKVISTLKSMDTSLFSYICLTCHGLHKSTHAEATTCPHRTARTEDAYLQATS